ILVFGEDVLDGLPYNRDCLRLQLERELKGKLLLLRKGYFETEGKEKQIRNLIRVSLTAFLSAFNALLYLKGVEIPRERHSLINSVEEAFAIDKDLFKQCLEIKSGQDKFLKSHIPVIFRAYVQEISKLCDKVDEIQL
ncbi:MAG: hypothetical protein PHN75_12720, partial [Syntrophales bacterium]|nr:hypothetical protein [Syntrophales bacterium]